MSEPLSESITVSRRDLRQALIMLVLLIGIVVAYFVGRDQAAKLAASDCPTLPAVYPVHCESDCPCRVHPRVRPVRPGDTGEVGQAKDQESIEVHPSELPATKKLGWVMPAARLGPCVWYASRDGLEPVPAMITQIGQGSVMLTVFPPDNRAGLPKDGVRHVTDPVIAQYPSYESGCWDYCHSDMRLNDCEKRLAKIELALAELEKQGKELMAALGEPLNV